MGCAAMTFAEDEAVALRRDSVSAGSFFMAEKIEGDQQVGAREGGTDVRRLGIVGHADNGCSDSSCDSR